MCPSDCDMHKVSSKKALPGTRRANSCLHCMKENTTLTLQGLYFCHCRQFYVCLLLQIHNMSAFHPVIRKVGMWISISVLMASEEHENLLHFRCLNSSLSAIFRCKGFVGICLLFLFVRCNMEVCFCKWDGVYGWWLTMPKLMDKHGLCKHFD